MTPIEFDKIIKQLSENTVKSLDLGFEDLTPTQIQQLTRTLTKNASLEQLDLNNNKIDDASAAQIAFLLLHNKTLKTLNLSFNQIGDVGLIHIASALKSNHSLETLRLRGNKIGDPGAKEIANTITANTLTKNTALKTLILQKNQIGDIGAIPIAIALTNNTSLQTLDLSANQISTVTVIQFTSTLNVNRSLQTLELDGPSINKTTLNSLKEKIKKNKELPSINAKENLDSDKTINPSLKTAQKLSDTNGFRLSLFDVQKIQTTFVSPITGEGMVNPALTSIIIHDSKTKTAVKQKKIYCRRDISVLFGNLESDKKELRESRTNLSLDLMIMVLNQRHYHLQGERNLLRTQIDFAPKNTAYDLASLVAQQTDLEELEKAIIEIEETMNRLTGVQDQNKKKLDKKSINDPFIPSIEIQADALNKAEDATIIMSIAFAAAYKATQENPDIRNHASEKVQKEMINFFQEHYAQDAKKLKADTELLEKFIKNNQDPSLKLSNQLLEIIKSLIYPKPELKKDQKDKETKHSIEKNMSSKSTGTAASGQSRQANEVSTTTAAAPKAPPVVIQAIVAPQPAPQAPPVQPAAAPQVDPNPPASSGTLSRRRAGR